MTRPNILLIVLDTARARTVYSMLDSEQLPGISRFREQGTLYSNAFTPAPWTLPSHATLFTGQRTSIHETHAGHTQFEPSSSPLAEQLRGVGYETRGISGNVWISPEFGFGQGFDELSMKWDYFWGGTDLSEVSAASGVARYTRLVSAILAERPGATIFNSIYAKLFANKVDDGAKSTTNRTVKWMSNRDREKPFFYFMNYLEPHLPYNPPSEFSPDDLVDGNDELLDPNPWEHIAGDEQFSEADFEVLRQLYRAEIAYLDSQLNRLYDCLVRTNELSNTAIFIVGDHGENIGDHDLMDHQYSLHDTLLHVPLIARFPPKFTAEVEQGLVSTRDIYPTICNLAGVDVPSDEAISSNDISEEPQRDAIFAEYRVPQPDIDTLMNRIENPSADLEWVDRSLRAVRTPSWKFIEAEDGTSELRSISDGSPNPEVIEDQQCVEEDLIERMDEQNVPLMRAGSDDTEISERSRERLNDLGYI
ncbi:putative sulfatase [Halococcus morrhuae DSM 1307]|uniref:Putative sulfatase n=1 Tax=Halococcus morrhuae DSM 1307 TaxID=931277 RepID=M0M6M4_HALMO|nr:sulfatase [Halococcus morrhuae]EMA41371.1 putative sulfatase [Halococcus morrhuae DSM 1307]